MAAAPAPAKSSASASSTPSPPPPLPFHKNVVAGALAGATELMVMYPLDVVKTRFQLAATRGASPSILGSLTSILKNEGFFAMYRGILPPLMIEPVKRAVKFSAQAKYKQLIVGDGKMTSAAAFLSGAMAGVTEGIIIAPTEVVKVRLQAKERQGMYKNTFDCFAKMYKQEGLKVFAAGLEAALVRQGIWNGAYFGFIHSTKQYLPKATSKSEEMSYNFLSGVVGGTVATTCNTPLDVVTSRMRNVLPGEPIKYRWGIPSLFMIAREEGWRALYKGYLPKLLRLGPGGGILLVTFEFVSNWLR